MLDTRIFDYNVYTYGIYYLHSVLSFAINKWYYQFVRYILNVFTYCYILSVTSSLIKLDTSHRIKVATKYRDQIFEK